jgi:hypothetical protein
VSASEGVRSEPAQIAAAFDPFVRFLENAGDPSALRRVLPVESTHGLDAAIEEHARDGATRCAGLHAVPGAKHEGGAMELERGQALLAWPGTGQLAVQPPFQATRVAITPPEMRVEREQNSGFDRAGALREPEPMIAIVIVDDSMESLVGQFGGEGQRDRIRERRSRKAVWGSRDNKRGREVSGLPNGPRGQGRYSGVRRERPTPNGARGALWLRPLRSRRWRCVPAPRHNPVGIACCGEETRT